MIETLGPIIMADVYLFPRKYSPLHDDEWDVQVSGGEDQSMMAEVNIFLENFHPP